MVLLDIYGAEADGKTLDPLAPADKGGYSKINTNIQGDLNNV